MTRLFNDPALFAAESRDGFVAANAAMVRAVPGGVSRATASQPGSVGVVIGGGSGHYPAFAGLVGAGLASGAAMGNLFASPSAHQVESVVRASNHDGGVLLTCGNYAGDVLNFTAAATALRQTGIEVETLWVTDDISSAPSESRSLRRGIAGGLIVYKIASASAETGAPLAEVARVAMRANDRTRTLGVAFGGCTLPGADAPLFTVPDGRMAVGMGIHGEPGISEIDVPTAEGLAGLFVDSLLAELPDDVRSPHGQRVIAILNGLGSVKYEELFVVYRTVAELLAEAGVEVASPQVGEFCTSFDMAGCSLSLCWLDDELEFLWNAPAESPSFRMATVPTAQRLPALAPSEGHPIDPIVGGSDDSRAAAQTIERALAAAANAVDQNVDELGRLDAIAGDGDHGIGMQRGASAALAAASLSVAGGAGAGSALRRAGAAWADAAGGTSGALWGLALRTMGDVFGDEDRVAKPAVANAIRAAAQAIRESGGAEVGDKTMVDALEPFAATLSAAADGGEALGIAWMRAAAAATMAAAGTADLVPRKGRARPHAAKSLGTPDPGAHSFALIVTAIAAVLDPSGASTNSSPIETPRQELE